MTNEKLLQQYAETGAILPEYQIRKVNVSLQKTYLRRRALQAKEEPRAYRLRGYELATYKEVDLQAMLNYLERLSKGNIDSLPMVEADMYYNAKGGEDYAKWKRSLSMREAHYSLDMDHYLGISMETLNSFSPKIEDFTTQRGKLLRRIIENGSPFDEVRKYIDRFLSEANIGVRFEMEEYEIIPTDYFHKHLPKFLGRFETILLPNRLRDNLLNWIVVKHGLPIPNGSLYRWSFTENFEAIIYLIYNDVMRLTPKDVIHMTEELKKAFVEENIKRYRAGKSTNIEGCEHLFSHGVAMLWKSR
jgi:hypothetical protein